MTNVLTAARFVLAPPRQLRFPRNMVKLWPVLNTTQNGLARGGYSMFARMFAPLFAVVMIFYLILFYYLWIAYVMWVSLVVNTWLCLVVWGWLASIAGHSIELAVKGLPE